MTDYKGVIIQGKQTRIDFWEKPMGVLLLIIYINNTTWVISLFLFIQRLQYIGIQHEWFLFSSLYSAYNILVDQIIGKISLS